MFHPTGIRVNGTNIALDSAKHELCFVSHAHSDHTEAFKAGKKSIIASDETFAIMGREPMPLPKMDGISLHPAGHMLGARQLLAETCEGTFAYTGDFSLHGAYTSKAAPILQCDTLMIDSTYCLPALALPSRSLTISAMRKFVKGNEGSIIVFGAYARGKSQELVRFLNIECGVAPVVFKQAAKICEAYGKCGVNLDYVAAESPEAEESMRHPFVAIMPPGKVNFDFGAKLSEAFGREVKTAVATGWAKVSRFPVDEAFAFSDHADFKDTMRYIYGSGAKKVVCANSGAKPAANCLRSLGIDAICQSELGQSLQSTLASCIQG